MVIFGCSSYLLIAIVHSYLSAFMELKQTKGFIGILSIVFHCEYEY